ncbi:hypothetical protein Q8791_08250 [Nocardiopsis sp. CT-R113]|uniref:ABC transporter permease n=1 Tax=Nocardiopsis codii TaxID=3065942 RepID=A0ABU7K4N8_9ACTN|nr:hypothetical protein [Nocardiopsis sp. CT-R113]MEE2037208.1 hypothetical protein [Nocardiopsis sp. CT-R113]
MSGAPTGTPEAEPGGTGRPGGGAAAQAPLIGRAPSAARLAATFGRLAWFTALRLLLNPFLLVALALTAVLTVSTTSQPIEHTVPDLYDSRVASALIVAVGLFAAVTFPAIREIRYGQSPVGPVGPVGRYLAVGAGSALAGWACVAAIMAFGAWQYPETPVGLVHPFSHVTPFVVVLIGPAGSMLLVAWTRSYAPLLLIALAVPTFSLYSITAFDTAQSVDRVFARVQSLALMAVDPFPLHSPTVSVLVHLYAGYAGLLVLGLLVLALAGTRRRASRAATSGVALVLLAGAAGTAGYGMSTYTWDDHVPDRLLYGADAASCRTREGITYCPMPGYEPWVDHWHSVLGPVVTALPESAADDIPVVWQDSSRFDRDPSGLPASRVVVYDFRFTDEPWWRLEMLSQASLALFGLDPLWERMCRADGQSRLLLAAWMAGLDAEAERVDRLTWSGTLIGEYAPSQQDLEVLFALLALPEERVFAVLQDHWEPLSSPRGRTEDLAELLDIPLRGSAHRIPTTADWDRMFPELERGYYAFTTDGTTCA